MKKSVITALLLFVSIITPASLNAFFGQVNRATDPKLVGTWEGETIQKDGTIKKWIQRRESNGRYRIQFKYYKEDQLVGSCISEGEWWMKDGRFCEIGDELSGQHFEYKVTWHSDTCVTMTSIKRNPEGDEYDGYTFTECLIDASG